MRIITIAALLSLPIIATTPTLAANYGSSATGGGSAGYNRGVATDYRLKKHHHVKKLHAQVKPQASKPSGGSPAAGQGAAAPAAPGRAGGEATKQPMGRP